MIADRENDVEILLTNKRCSKGCSYDFEITYGDESFLLEQTVIYFSQTGHLLDKNGGLILANKGELYRLTKP